MQDLGDFIGRIELPRQRDRAEILRGYILANGTPVRHRDKSEVTGVIRGHCFEDKRVYYLVDWLVEGYAPQVLKSHVRELPTPLHLLASQSN